MRPAGTLLQGVAIMLLRLGLAPLLAQAALAAAGRHSSGPSTAAAAAMDRKASPAHGSSISLEPTGAPWLDYAGDQGIATPTTFSWTDGTPKA